MLFLILPVLFIALAASLYRHLRKQRNRRARWRAALRLGLGIGVPRAALAALGWSLVERTGGPSQVWGYALAMLAWPEAALMGRTGRTPAPPWFLVLLSCLLAASTLVAVCLIALLADQAQSAPE
jgi:hypothetical protein